MRKNCNNLDAILRYVVDGPVVYASTINKAYRDFAAVSWPRHRLLQTMSHTSVRQYQ